MSGLEQELDAIAAETGFSGVVRVDRGGRTEIAKAYGLAHRGWEIPNTVDTRFALASGAKTLTALAVVSLIEEGVLARATTARPMLGDDLPLIGDEVTVGQLLSHRSGIGDYFDEEVHGDLADYAMPVPVHQLATAEDYVAVLDGFPAKFPAGERFAYCNGGYVVLALIAERASGVDYHDLVRQRVCEPAGMHDTEFLRSDELPGGSALGYLDADGLKTNVLHLPVRGVGDGGAYSTVADVSSFWRALFAGGIVSTEWVAQMVRDQSGEPPGSPGYGLGFWLPPSGGVQLEGCDAGVSFRSVHDATRQVTWTVISNTTDGAWPLAGLLARELAN